MSKTNENEWIAVFKSFNIRVQQTLIAMTGVVAIVACMSMSTCNRHSEQERTKRWEASQRSSETFWESRKSNNQDNEGE